MKSSVVLAAFVVSLATAQIANRDLLPTRLTTENKAIYRNVSQAWRKTIERALSTIKKWTCFDFNAKKKTRSKLVFDSTVRGLCTFKTPLDLFPEAHHRYLVRSQHNASLQLVHNASLQLVDHPEFLIHVHGCKGSGDIINLFFAMAGLQRHETRPDRDFYISRHTADEDKKTLPEYTTYGTYDIYSIMHSSASDNVYKCGTCFTAKQGPYADIRRFPDSDQMEYIGKQAMGQRTTPTAVDWMQINEAWCPYSRDLCHNCGMGGYFSSKTKTCLCPRYRSGFRCQSLPKHTQSVRLTPGRRRKTISIGSNQDRPYLIKTVSANCPSPGYSLGINFQFLTANTELYTHGGRCGDYISITSDDIGALPREVRLCGAIKDPVADFTIVTNSGILIMYVKHESGPIRREGIKLNVTGVCENLNTSMSLPIVWTAYGQQATMMQSIQTTSVQTIEPGFKESNSAANNIAWLMNHFMVACAMLISR